MGYNEFKPPEDTGQRLDIRDGKYARKIEGILYEFSNTEDAVYGPELIDRLVPDGVDDREKGSALVECLRGVLAEYTAINPSVVCPPFEYNPNTFEIFVPIVESVQSSKEQRLSYVPGLIQYYKNTFEHYLDLLDHPDQVPIAYHTDLVKPSQYTYGVINGVNNNEPTLYLTDLDPEINCIAVKDDFGWVIDKHYQAQLIELAGLCYYFQHPDTIKDNLGELTKLLRMNGYGEIARDMDAALKSGRTPYEIENDMANISV